MDKYSIPNGIHLIKFTNRPDPVPYNYRISYKVAQVCLILYLAVKKGGCSFQMLQVVSTSLTSDYDMEQLKLLVDGGIPDYSIIKFDPAVNYAVQFAIAEKIIIRQGNGKLKLTDKGKSFCRLILEDETILVEEKRSLKNLQDINLEEIIQNIRNKWGEISANY